MSKEVKKVETLQVWEKVENSSESSSQEHVPHVINKDGAGIVVEEEESEAEGITDQTIWEGDVTALPNSPFPEVRGLSLIHI